jgi:NADPH:quinone reductase-like Zn-dependent oxidoreductase
MSQRTSTRAILIERCGQPDVFVEREMPLADLGPNDVHLRIEAAGVNFADLIMRMGLYGTVPPRPFSPGFEIAGTVARAGSEVEGWQHDDRAVAISAYGGYARDIVVPADRLFPYPGSLSPAEAAAIPVVFLTAWVCLFESARARAGETALILGAGGGVGTAAVQLAVRHGMRVIGTAGTPEKRAFVADELGAAACFDSRGDWETEVRSLVGPRGIDIALDPVGGKATAACRRLLSPLGHLVFYGMSAATPHRKRSWPRAIQAWLRTPRFHPIQLVEPNIGISGVHLLHLGDKGPRVLPRAMQHIYRAVEQGELRPILDRTFPLDRDGAVEAHRYLHARRNLGKVVLAVETSKSREEDESRPGPDTKSGGIQ